MSEIQTVWTREATELSEIQTSSDFRHSLYYLHTMTRAVSEIYHGGLGSNACTVILGDLIAPGNLNKTNQIVL